MTDHIGEATEKVSDFPTNDPTNPAHRLGDDLQVGRIKDLAVSADVAFVLQQIAAKDATIKGLIAELKEARATIADVDSAARQAASVNDAGYTVTVERTATHIYAMTSAFLARNGKGEDL